MFNLSVEEENSFNNRIQKMSHSVTGLARHENIPCKETQSLPQSHQTLSVMTILSCSFPTLHGFWDLFFFSLSCSLCKDSLSLCILLTNYEFVSIVHYPREFIPVRGSTPDPPLDLLYCHASSIRPPNVVGVNTDNFVLGFV